MGGDGEGDPGSPGGALHQAVDGAVGESGCTERAVPLDWAKERAFAELGGVDPGARGAHGAALGQRGEGDGQDAALAGGVGLVGADPHLEPGGDEAQILDVQGDEGGAPKGAGEAEGEESAIAETSSVCAEGGEHGGELLGREGGGALWGLGLGSGEPAHELEDEWVMGRALVEGAACAVGDGDRGACAAEGRECVPTATDRELARRRRKRAHRPKSGSPRHQGRAKRARHPKQPRRKKGDKANSGKMVTMVVMYTLRRRGRRLDGPLNRRHYASFGPKRHGFAVARREANKRGFTRDSGRLVQVLTDGDNDYADLAAAYFPEAMHTVDCYHVFEKLWEAVGSFLKEGSAELRAWVNEQKAALFRDDVETVLAEMQRRWEAIAPTGPGNKGRRQRLRDARRYLEKRVNKIRYGSLRRQNYRRPRDMARSAPNLAGQRFGCGASSPRRSRGAAACGPQRPRDDTGSCSPEWRERQA